MLPHGRFIGRVLAEWLPDGRRMKLAETFGYEDASGIIWEAPAGSVVDGASIPTAFWSVIGGPFEGRFRPASVVHDVACDQRDRPWQAVHRAFHAAMLCGGVESWRAKAMFAAVWHFGPRWDVDGRLTGVVEPSRDLALAFVASVREDGPSPHLIETAEPTWV